jgi:hypothetical protein
LVSPPEPFAPSVVPSRALAAATPARPPAVLTFQAKRARERLRVASSSNNSLYALAQSSAA